MAFLSKVITKVFGSKAQKDLKQCLEDLPESQWGVCERRYYKAIANC